MELAHRRVGRMPGSDSEPSGTGVQSIAQKGPRVDMHVDLSLLSQVDFAANGLFWDRPGMDNGQLLRILSDPENPQYRWAWTRTLERLPSRVITQSLSLRDLQRLIRLVRLRQPLQRAWESAIAFWTEEPRSRVS